MYTWNEVGGWNGLRIVLPRNVYSGLCPAVIRLMMSQVRPKEVRNQEFKPMVYAHAVRSYVCLLLHLFGC